MRTSLFDRLCDTAEATLAAAVLRDLQALLDTTRPPRPALSTPARASTLGLLGLLDYGLPALVGRPASDRDLDALCEAVRHAIVAFEPRLEAASVRVQAQPVGQAGRPVRLLDIAARWRAGAEAGTEVWHLQSVVDLDTGSQVLRESGH